MTDSEKAMILHLTQKIGELQTENAALRTTIEVYEGNGELTCLRKQNEWLSARLETEENITREQYEIIESQKKSLKELLIRGSLND